VVASTELLLERVVPAELLLEGVDGLMELLEGVAAMELLDGEKSELLEGVSSPDESSEQAMRVSMLKTEIMSIFFINII
jgi:hypothetical protein